MKICVIGNSHIAAVKQAWDEAAASKKGIELTFFGGTGQTTADFEVTKRGKAKVLTPGSERLAKEMAQTSGGADHVDFSGFDACILHGLVVFPRYLIGTSSAVKKDITSRCSVHSLAARLVPKVRECTDIPIAVSHRPVQALAEGEIIINMAGYTPYEQVLVDLKERFPDENVTWIDQPASTRDSEVTTAPSYSIGSTRLISGNTHKSQDNLHMNKDYGGLLLNAFFNWAEAH